MHLRFLRAGPAPSPPGSTKVPVACGSSSGGMGRPALDGDLAAASGAPVVSHPSRVPFLPLRQCHTAGFGFSADKASISFRETPRSPDDQHAKHPLVNFGHRPKGASVGLSHRSWDKNDLNVSGKA